MFYIVASFHNIVVHNVGLLCLSIDTILILYTGFFLSHEFIDENSCVVYEYAAVSALLASHSVKHRSDNTTTFSPDECNKQCVTSVQINEPAVSKPLLDSARLATS